MGKKQTTPTQQNIGKMVSRLFWQQVALQIAFLFLVMTCMLREVFLAVLCIGKMAISRRSTLVRMHVQFSLQVCRVGLGKSISRRVSRVKENTLFFSANSARNLLQNEAKCHIFSLKICRTKTKNGHMKSSRRAFIKTAAMGAAGVGIASSVPKYLLANDLASNLFFNIAISQFSLASQFWTKKL